MDAAGPGRCQTAADSAGELGIATGHEGGCFFMPHLNKADSVGTSPQRLHNAVYSVPRQSEDSVYAPVHQRLNQNVCCRWLRHIRNPRVWVMQKGLNFQKTCRATCFLYRAGDSAAVRYTLSPKCRCLSVLKTGMPSKRYTTTLKTAALTVL